MAISQEARQPTEGGLLNHDVWFIRESNTGELPTEDDWERFSDRMTELWGWQPEGNVEGDRGISDVDVPEDGFYGGSEEHEASFTYRWQKAPLDDSQSINGACFDALFRTEDGLQPNTHTVVDREHHPGGGNDGAGFYTVTVGVGGRPDVAESEGDAEEGAPLGLTLEYMFEKVRQYRIHQPSTEGGLVATSSSKEDTGITVTAESLDGTTSATGTLDGTSAVSIDGQFSDVGAIHLDSDAVGDVTISVNTADTQSPAAGATITEIEGRTSHSPPGSTAYEGDRGVPLLGNGTRESEVQAPGSRTYEHFIGDRLERAGTDTAPVGPRLTSATLSVENNNDTNADASSRRMMIDRGQRDATIEGSIAGPAALAKTTMDHLTTTGGTITWYFESFSLIFPGATITEAGEKAEEVEQVAMYVDTTFSSSGIKLGDEQGNPVSLPV